MTTALKLEWFVTNFCNYKCSYCPSHLRDGQLQAPTVSELEKACNNIAEQAILNDFEYVLLQFNGGEPTASDSLRELLNQELDRILKFKLVTNASAELEWWKAIKHKIYEIDLTYHLSCNLEHFNAVLELFMEANTPISIRVPMPAEEDKWNLALQAYKQFPNELFPEMIMLYKNLSKGSNQFLDYNAKQWDIYFTNKNIDHSTDDGLIPFGSNEYNKVNHLNDYYGNLCYAGVEQAVITYYGDVFRGWCMANAPMGNVYRNTFKLNPKPLPCPKIQCGNGFDQQARKSLKSWGLS